MHKKLLAAALVATCLAAPARANAPTRTWWCTPSGMTNLTPLFRLIGWDCADSRPMDR